MTSVGVLLPTVFPGTEIIRSKIKQRGLASTRIVTLNFIIAIKIQRFFGNNLKLAAQFFLPKTRARWEDSFLLRGHFLNNATSVPAGIWFPCDLTHSFCLPSPRDITSVRSVWRYGYEWKTVPQSSHGTESRKRPRDKIIDQTMIREISASVTQTLD